MLRKTIYDVAKALNLSPGTISKVLNNNGNVSDETRKRVQDYVKATGYVADTNARILKSRFSYTIGVIFSDISLVGLEHPFFGSIIQHFKTYVEKAGYEIVFITSKVGGHELTYLEWCRNKKVDGVVIVSGNINNAYIQELVNSDIPCVSTDIIMPKLHSVLSDDVQGIQLAIDYLLSKGLTKLGVLSGPETSRAFWERIQAFKAIMEKKGLSAPSKWIKVAPGFGFTSALQATKEWCQEVDELPEGILALSDDLAFGLIRGLETFQKKVPTDISVIGFDDINFARLYTPTLSTIRQNKQAIGERAAQMLLDLIQKGNGKQTTVIRIPVELVLRESTR